MEGFTYSYLPRLPDVENLHNKLRSVCLSVSVAALLPRKWLARLIDPRGCPGVSAKLVK